MRNTLKTLWVTLSLAAAACGGSDGKDLNKFIGVWAPTSGTYTQTCATDPANSGIYQVTGTDTWTTGTTSDLVQTVPGNACVFHADVSADTASGAPAGQTCTVNVTNGDAFTEVSTYSAYTFVVSPDGATATENYSGTLVLTDNTEGWFDNCTFTQTASYAKQ